MVDGPLPELRLTDTERDDIVSQLGLAMSEGRLDIPEFEERSKLVYAAKVPSDLVGVLEGLPITKTPAVSREPALATKGRKRWFFTLLGDRVQRGDMDLGDKATSLCLIGDTTFDLTDVSAPNVDLRVISLIGDITIRVRPGTNVDANSIVLIGDRNDSAPIVQGSPTMNLRLRIVSLISDVQVTVVE